MRYLENVLDEEIKQGAVDSPYVEGVWFWTDGKTRGAEMTISRNSRTRLTNSGFFIIDIIPTNDTFDGYTGPGDRRSPRAGSETGQIAQQLELLLDRAIGSPDSDTSRVEGVWLSPGGSSAELTVIMGNEYFLVGVGPIGDRYHGRGGPGGRREEPL